MTTVNHNMTSQRSRSQLVVLLHFGDGGTRSCHPYPADLRHRSSHHTHVPTNCGTRVKVSVMLFRRGRDPAESAVLGCRATQDRRAAAHVQQLGEAHGRALRAWLEQRRTAWPHTPRTCSTASSSSNHLSLPRSHGHDRLVWFWPTARDRDGPWGSEWVEWQLKLGGWSADGPVRQPCRRSAPAGRARRLARRAGCRPRG